MNISHYKVERGGDITYHGPGQLVGYPIFKIKNYIAGVRPFIHKLEQVLSDTLLEFGIKTYVDDKFVGVWHKTGKIVAIGVAFKKWVAYHGFAMNVNTDLSFFSLINPCGLEEKGVTSMKKIVGSEVNMEEVKSEFIKKTSEVFGYGQVKVIKR